MFDIFCHKITFVFQDTQVEVNDLLDFLVPKDAPHKIAPVEIANLVAEAQEIERNNNPEYSERKQHLVNKLIHILAKRKGNRESVQRKTHNEKDTELRKRDQVSKKR